MIVNGSLVNYYFHCKRQCYLSGNKINMEDNSELVKIGKQLHEDKYKEKDSEIKIDNIKVDKIKGEYLIEYKKSNADIKASKWQLYYYLKVLKDKGINKKGKLICFEKKKESQKVFELELTKDIEKKLRNIEIEIDNLIKSKDVPAFEFSSKCKKCAYYNYCVI